MCGFEILERNWRTRYCEIDIVAMRADVYCFIEVKYRSSQRQGGGFAAITTKKLRQMSFAAELYASRYTAAQQLQLVVAAVNNNGAVELVEIS